MNHCLLELNLERNLVRPYESWYIAFSGPLSFRPRWNRLRLPKNAPSARPRRIAPEAHCGGHVALHLPARRAERMKDPIVFHCVWVTLNPHGASPSQVGPDGAERLAAALSQNSSLQSLNMSRNRLGDEGAKALASGVEKNTSLRRLELGHNDIGDEGAGHLAMGLSHNLSLESVDLTGNR
jgi:hypothetical protein